MTRGLNLRYKGIRSGDDFEINNKPLKQICKLADKTETEKNILLISMN